MHVSIYAYIRTHVQIQSSRCIETRCIHMSTKYKLCLIQERIKHGLRMQLSACDIFVHTTYYHHPFSMFQCYLFSNCLLVKYQPSSFDHGSFFNECKVSAVYSLSCSQYYCININDRYDLKVE